MANHKRKFSNIELSFFCNQLTMILSSGISAMEGFSMMLEEAEKEEKAIISEILEQLEMGSSLYEAFLTTDLFPNYLLQMVKIGEETGDMEALAKEFFDYIISVANGEETNNEKNGYREISIFKDGVTL